MGLFRRSSHRKKARSAKKPASLMEEKNAGKSSKGKDPASANEAANTKAPANETKKTYVLSNSLIQKPRNPLDRPVLPNEILFAIVSEMIFDPSTLASLKLTSHLFNALVVDSLKDVVTHALPSLIASRLGVSIYHYRDWPFASRSRGPRADRRPGIAPGRAFT